MSVGDQLELRATHGSPVTLAGDDRGRGTAATVVLLHGLTATRDYVVMRSALLERAGHRVIAYDARGHGGSSPAPRSDEYGYELLARDLEHVLDDRKVDRAILVGVSLGAHTALRFALSSPERVAGLVLITPSFDPATVDDVEAQTKWRPLAETLRRSGAEAFASAYPLPRMRGGRERAIRSAIRLRVRAHQHPVAVADAMCAIEGSRPFDSLERLGAISARTLVVASRDEFDPEHPYTLARRYADAIPGAELACEAPGRLPLAWSGRELSRLIMQFSGCEELDMSGCGRGE